MLFGTIKQGTDIMRNMTNYLFMFLIIGVCWGALEAEEYEGSNKSDIFELKPLLREGHVLEGVEGTILKSGEGGSEKWFFKLNSDVSDQRNSIEAGTKLELLPCSTLEQIAAFYKDNDEYKEADNKETSGQFTEYPEPIRLWARVSTYNQQNYLFAIHLITMTRTGEDDREKDKANEDGVKNQDDEQKEESILPDEILKKLKPKTVVDLSKMQKMLKTEGDVVLASRSGFLKSVNGEPVFEIDAFGRKLEGLSFEVLPCHALDIIESKLDESLGRQRYRISGILTTYKGRQYILPQAFSRTYTHGNFAR